MLTIGRNVLSDPSKIIQSARFVQEEVRLGMQGVGGGGGWMNKRDDTTGVQAVIDSSCGSEHNQHMSGARLYKPHSPAACVIYSALFAQEEARAGGRVGRGCVCAGFWWCVTWSSEEK
jgi:hypothetical protein